MLAAGGLLGLLLIGAAVGGLMAGADTAGADEDGPGQDRRGDADDAGGAVTDVMCTETPVMEAGGAGADADPIPDAPDVQGVADSDLARLLFGSPVDPGAASDPAAGEDDPFAALEDHVRHEPEATDAVGAQRVTYDVVATAAFGGGPDLPWVHDFDAGTDRLILDFDGTEADAPVIGIDLKSSPGDAVVLADGVAVTLVKDAPGMTPGHVDIVMSGDPTGTPAALEASDDTGQFPPRVERFDPEEDRIEVIYDPAMMIDPDATPDVDVVDFDDGTGASITVDGAPVLHVVGAQGLDPATIVTRAAANGIGA